VLESSCMDASRVIASRKVGRIMGSACQQFSMSWKNSGDIVGRHLRSQVVPDHAHSDRRRAARSIAH
jgi:hypothetical protein